jgi:epoxyqueuosine reductase QueG
MTKEIIISRAEEFTRESPLNYIASGIALAPECSGLRIFDTPIFAFGDAGDEIYLRYMSPEIIGDHFIPPSGWLPGAKTVISFFLPYEEKIRAANAKDPCRPADEWLHGRYEGQALVAALSEYVGSLLEDAGCACVVPALDPGYGSGGEYGRFSSNWSERHAAYACGLGTFGLSKGVITAKGTCGRFGSVITERGFPYDKRPYNGVYEYCNMCGECAARCPAGAISLESGKNHVLCSDFLDKTREAYKPRYGCGKCQVGVPCESHIPGSDDNG